MIVKLNENILQFLTPDYQEIANENLILVTSDGLYKKKEEQIEFQIAHEDCIVGRDLSGDKSVYLVQKDNNGYKVPDKREVLHTDRYNQLKSKDDELAKRIDCGLELKSRLDKQAESLMIKIENAEKQFQENKREYDSVYNQYNDAIADVEEYLDDLKNLSFQQRLKFLLFGYPEEGL